MGDDSCEIGFHYSLFAGHAFPGKRSEHARGTNAVYPPLININAGAHCIFIVSASGTAPLSYQWAYNGTLLPGSTTSILGLTNLVAANTVSNAGSYSVTVTNLGTTNAGASPAVGNCVLQVYSGTYPLAPTNLAVLRSSDGISSTGANANWQCVIYRSNDDERNLPEHADDA